MSAEGDEPAKRRSPLVVVLLALSVLGFAISALAHIASLFGKLLFQADAMMISLHVGMFVLLVPMFILTRDSDAASPMRLRVFQLLNDAGLSRLNVPLVLLAIYAAVNFGLANGSGTPPVHDTPVGAPMVRSFSGVWMVFYSTECAVFLALLRNPLD